MERQYVISYSPGYRHKRTRSWTASVCFWCTSLHLQEGKSFCTSHHLPGLLLHVSSVLPHTCRRGKVSVPVTTYLDCFCMFLVYLFTPAGGEQFLYQSSLTWTASACFCTSHHLPGLLLHVSGVLPHTCRRGKVSVPVTTYLDCFCMFLVYFFTPAGGEQFLYQSLQCLVVHSISVGVTSQLTQILTLEKVFHHINTTIS